MLNSPHLKKVLWFWMATLWSASAIAAQTSFGHDITSIPLDAMAIALALGIVGGLAYTTQKIAKPDMVVRSIPLEIFKDLINSMVAGLVAFFLSAWGEAPAFAQVLLITVAGYGGSRFLEQVLTESLSRIGTLISGAKKTGE